MKLNRNSFKSSQTELLASLYGNMSGVVNLAPETPHKVGGCDATGRLVAPQQSQPISSVSPEVQDRIRGERSDASLGYTPNLLHPRGGVVAPQPSNGEACSESEKCKKSASPAKLRKLRADRYRLLESSAYLATREGKKHTDRLSNNCALNYHKVCKCRRVQRSMIEENQGKTQVYKSKEHGKAFYGGVVICGNVWVCPVCAGVVQERRRAEIAQAIEWAYANGLKPVMLTFTFPHKFFDKLIKLLNKQKGAFVKLRSGKAWQGFKSRIGFTGLIRSLEVTHGGNGWHPHTHELWFVDKGANADYIKHFVTERWLTMCQKEGLVPRGKIKAFRKHAVDVKDNCSASEYMAKQDDSKHWGADREIAKASSKRSYGKGKHPFALLDDYSTNGDEYSGKLFMEYLEAMRGRPQIFWSHGLKALVGIDDITDEELAGESQDTADLLTHLNMEEWRLVLKHKARAKILDAAEIHGLPGIHALLSDLYYKEIEEMDSS